MNERPGRLDQRRDRQNGRDGGDGLPPGGGERDLPKNCPDAERLAEYADGLLDAPARAAIEAHLITCADCRFTIVETMAFLGAEAPAAGRVDIPAGSAAGSAADGVADLTDRAAGQAQPAMPVATGSAPDAGIAASKPGTDAGETSTSTSAPARVIPFRTRSWVTGVGATLAAAAALVLIVRIVSPEWLPASLGGGPPLEGLVAALDTQRVRPVEGRLMGGFAHKPAPSPTRGGADRLGRRWSPDVTHATATIEHFAEGNPSARARAALGVALIVDGDLDGAVTALEAAAADLRDDAAVHTNLSAAYLARARWFNHPEDWPKALGAADRAITLDANAPEPYFNRALALEGLEQQALEPSGRAVKAWGDYASRERNPAWIQEAEERRQALSTRQP